MATPHYYIGQQEIRSNPGFRHVTAPGIQSIADRSYMSKDKFFCNTSGWEEMHIAALHGLLFEDFPMDRICTPTSFISPTYPLAAQVKEHLGLSANEVKASRYNTLSATESFYTELSTLLRTNTFTPSLTVKNTRPVRNPKPFAYISPQNKDTDTIMFPVSTPGSSYNSPQPVQ